MAFPAFVPLPLPGTYPGAGRATLLNTNQQMYLWAAQTVATGTSSIAVQLERQKSAFYPWGCSCEIGFSGAPGTFQLDIQAADTDDDAHYVTIYSVTGNLNASNNTLVQLTPNIFFAKFLRFHLTTLTNAVTVTAKVTR